MSPEYYTAKDGSIHYEEGKTSLNDGETYCILPSYSPENNPSNYNSPSDANCAIDISACRDNLNMLIKVMGDVDKSADTSNGRNLKKIFRRIFMMKQALLKNGQQLHLMKIINIVI